MTELFTASQVARMLNRSLRTLHRWRTTTGTGPTALKIASRWYYRADECEQFVHDAWLNGVHRWPGVGRDDPEPEQVAPAAPPAEVIDRVERPRGAPVARPERPVARPGDQHFNRGFRPSTDPADLYKNVGEPVDTTRSFQ